MRQNELVPVYRKRDGKKINIMAGEVLSLEKQGKLDTKKSANTIKRVKADKDLIAKAAIQSAFAIKKEAKEKQREADKEAKRATKGRDLVEVTIRGKKKKVMRSEVEMLTKLGKIDGSEEDTGDLEDLLLEGEMLIEDGELEKAEELLKDIDEDKIPEKISTAFAKRKKENRVEEALALAERLIIDEGQLEKAYEILATLDSIPEEIVLSFEKVETKQKQNRVAVITEEYLALSDEEFAEKILEPDLPNMPKDANKEKCINIIATDIMEKEYKGKPQTKELKVEKKTKSEKVIGKGSLNKG